LVPAEVTSADEHGPVAALDALYSPRSFSADVALTLIGRRLNDRIEMPHQLVSANCLQ
jgi:hypothetical protein